MTPLINKQIRILFQDLLAAAKSLDWQRNDDPRIHHSNARNVTSDRDWEAESEETLRLSFPGDNIFHLQIRLERLGNEDRRRVIIFGRRVKALTSVTPNTQRATFNSHHADGFGFWLRPNLDGGEKTKLSKHLPGPAFPRWDGKHIQLGSDVPYVTLRRFLIALAVIEQIKGNWAAGPWPFAPGLGDDRGEFETRDLADLIVIDEGRVLRVPITRRSRCQRLLGEAREHFRKQSPDGRLHCQVCNWCPSIPTQAEIIQIHHLKQLRDYPKNGRRLTLAKALEYLAPLCPNCHRILESRPGGGCYSFAELTEHIRAINS